jgi:hypothetical protein
VSFDRVFVISLARRPDRLAAFRERLGAAWPDGLSRLTVFQAIDGELCPKPDWFTQPKGAFGCWQSHHRLLETCLMDGTGDVLVFEDDATFVPEFEIALPLLMSMVPDDWGQLYIGGQHLAKPHPVNDAVVKGTNVNRTHAYAVRGGEPMRHLYRWLHAGHHWKGRHHVDHHYGRLHKTGWHVYASKNWLCGQAAGPSDISGRSEGERAWSR